MRAIQGKNNNVSAKGTLFSGKEKPWFRRETTDFPWEKGCV
jgi:hypothetical protein